MNQRIYLDHNATTRLDPSVLEAVIRELKEEGNPSSIHTQGQQARQRLNHYRQIIAQFLHVSPSELVFTSSGTEGATLFLHGFLQGNYGGQIVTSNAEHACVHETVLELQKRGCEVCFLPVGLRGAVQPEAVKAALTSSTRLITLMAVNNETGVKTDWEAIAAIAKEANIPFVVDGVSLLGKEPFSIPQGVTAMFFSGHKCHAPKGIGVAFCRRGYKLSPLFLGGNQEFQRRAGTENLPGIAGLAKAIEILQTEQDKITTHLLQMRNRLEQGILEQIKDVVINGEGERVANTTNLSFLGVDGESLLVTLDMEGLSVSHGSACSSGALEPSRILLNMGMSFEQARSSIRLSISRFTTQEEIDRSITILTKTVQQLRYIRHQSVEK
jgi:cysteine desulfurase